MVFSAELFINSILETLQVYHSCLRAGSHHESHWKMFAFCAIHMQSRCSRISAHSFEWTKITWDHTKSSACTATGLHGTIVQCNLVQSNAVYLQPAFGV